MRRTRLLLVFFLLTGVLQAQDSTAVPAGSGATASLEAGVESAQRRYIRPQLRFEFPVSIGRVFADLDYYHRTNGDLEGEIDFWMGLGFSRPLSSHLEIELELKHFCRHKTSRDYPIVLDINEVLGRCRYVSESLGLAVGAGTYLGTSNHYDGLLVLSLTWPRVLNSEFSAAAELKWVDFQEVFYEFELAAALNTGVDLVARTTRHYAYPQTTYFGLRFHSHNAAEQHVDQFQFRTAFLPDDEARKVSSAVEYNLHFFKTPLTQLLLTLNSDIPIERGDSFLGSFRPEEVKYRVGLAYEKLITRELYAFAYGRYDLHMPVDVAETFTSSFGAGLGLKNQTYFKKLDRNFRYVIFAGRNYGHGHDLGMAVGLNTTGKSVNIGGDLQLDFKSGDFHAFYEFFAEIGSAPKIRPFIAFEQRTAQQEDESFSRFLFGIDLYTWH